MATVDGRSRMEALAPLVRAAVAGAAEGGGGRHLVAAAAAAAIRAGVTLLEAPLETAVDKDVAVREALARPRLRIQVAAGLEGSEPRASGNWALHNDFGKGADAAPDSPQEAKRRARGPRKRGRRRVGSAMSTDSSEKVGTSHTADELSEQANAGSTGAVKDNDVGDDMTLGHVVVELCTEKAFVGLNTTSDQELVDRPMEPDAKLESAWRRTSPRRPSSCTPRQRPSRRSRTTWPRP
ncbi:unnamed protein product [Prorocentrum cordatum]|uniref:Uncharacterized protein n=1 Tax=Prorocentrum cordatum TaxID=2364126 RepID=A0ABN9RJQ1_9DINO|nr:unnamed protein product [Polarella glacialis]